MENGKKPISATLTYNEVSGQPNGHLLGLTKREYFAGLIMQGLCACPDLALLRKALAEEAVKQADDLLAELDKPETE
jgi:hypothetical protein